VTIECDTVKYVDDTTLTEIVQRSAHSNIHDCFQQLLSWSEHNGMAVNFQKTKEMVMGPPSLVSNYFYQSRVLLVALSKSPLLNFWDFIWTPTFLGGPTSRLCHLKPPSDSTFSSS